MATAASVGETGAVSDANLQVPGGNLVASAPKSHKVGLADSTRTAPDALPSRPGSTARPPAFRATREDSIQPRRAALCSRSQARHFGWLTNCTGKEVEERSTKGNDMDMLTNL